SKEDLASIEQPATSLSLLLKHTIDLEEIRNMLVERVQKRIMQRFPKILAREMNHG
ncbi:biotin synthetase domain protein, partial [Chlamydia psittaci 84-8471/1]